MMTAELADGVGVAWAPVALRVKELEEQLSSMRDSLICAFNQLLDLKDLNTGYHSTRLAEWAVRVAQELGMEESVRKDVEVAALLHDIGKIGVPDAILRKPSRLTVEEYALMKKHGFDLNPDDANYDNQAYIVRAACEQFWFMRAVTQKIGNAVLNNDNFMAGVNQIGSSFPSLNTYVARLGPNKHDGASAVRNEQYFDSCTCYRYTSAPYEV